MTLLRIWDTIWKTLWYHLKRLIWNIYELIYEWSKLTFPKTFPKTPFTKDFIKTDFFQKRSVSKGFKLYEKNNISFVLCLHFIAIFVHRTHEFPFFSFTSPFRKVPARLVFSFVFSDLLHGNHELTLGSQTSLTGH